MYENQQDQEYSKQKKKHITATTTLPGDILTASKNGLSSFVTRIKYMKIKNI